MRGVADGKGRGDESEEGECEVDGIVQEIAAVALFEGQYRRHNVSCKVVGGVYVWDCGGDEIDEIEG